jgi:hypothetical protein
MKVVQINKPSISDIETMYQLIILKYPQVINNYIEASKLICQDFNTEVDQYDLERALDVSLETEIEDVRLIYSHIK